MKFTMNIFKINIIFLICIFSFFTFRSYSIEKVVKWEDKDEVIKELTQGGYRIISIREELRGEPDEILSVPQAEYMNKNYDVIIIYEPIQEKTKFTKPHEFKNLTETEENESGFFSRFLNSTEGIFVAGFTTSVVSLLLYDYMKKKLDRKETQEQKNN